MANERISWAGTDDGSLQYVTVATRPSPPRVGLRQYHGPNVARICQPTYSFPRRRAQPTDHTCVSVGPPGLCPVTTPRTGKG
ncbi:hypothetical protein DPMN_176842 [Dreissena polymorpha]|uniref:Uncharacterized protein n=1 Tax=Dreissena polymorpha TaxID=45954 RepID=A0A9D4EBS7_DREPO|nr:hypothetical protein DPMN_176842 [Dreissena polymorpha]